MKAIRSKLARAALVAGLLAAGAPAMAANPQLTGSDYTVTYVGGRYVAPPAVASTLSLGLDDNSASISLPFRFDYFGGIVDHLFVHSNGFAVFTDRSSPFGSFSNNIALPYGATLYGLIAPLWDDLNPLNQGGVKYWTDGTAPNRRFIVSWEGVAVGAQQYVGNVTFQFQLFETSHRIVFAYKPDSPVSTWLNLSYTAGICPFDTAVSGTPPVGFDKRYCDAFNHLTTNSGHPPSDVQFDVTTFVHVTGSLVYDRVVSDATGLGNSMQLDAPAAGARIKCVQPNDGMEAASAYCGADGRFDVVFAGRPGQQPMFYLEAQSAAVAVRTSAGAPIANRFLTYNVDYWTDADIGTFQITQASDTSGSLRAALSIIAAADKAYSVLRGAVPSSLPPQVDAYYDVASVAPTHYVPHAGVAPDWIRIGSSLAANPDAWDEAVVIKTYARHVLDAVAGAPAATNFAFDAVSDPQNAFAEGFGYALFAAATHASKAYDGVNATTTSVVDLEDPNPTTAKGPDVAAWVAAALYDLVDGANEPHDRADGTGVEDRFVRVVESMTSTPDAATFFDAWGTNLGYDGTALARDFVHHGLVRDDPAEPNEDAAEPADLGAAPLLTTGRVLLRYDEDWFSFQLAAAVPTLHADFAWNGVGQSAETTIQLLDAAGGLIASATPIGVGGLKRATTGGLPAGAYRLRVRHDLGVTLDPYRLQVYEPLAMTRTVVGAWTVGRPLNQSVGPRGGVGERKLSAEPPGSQPPGLHFGLDGDSMLGTPTDTGGYQLTLKLVDSGDPAHSVVASQSFVVNPPLVVELGPYVGFPVGRTFEVARLAPGGTAPLTFDLLQGAVPDGLTLESGVLRLHGSASAAGSAKVTVHGEDVAGSESDATTTIVGCVPFVARKAAVDLESGDAACGAYVDAVAGSHVAVTAGTAKKRAKRTLTATLVGPDGRVVATAKLVGGRGKGKASVVQCPLTGRYFAIFASADGDATQLAVSDSVTPPKAGKGVADASAATGPIVIPVGALAGAQLDLTIRPDRKSGLACVVQALVDPDGKQSALDGLVTDKKGVLHLVAPLPVAGTWQVFVAATGGTKGRASYSYKIKQPKGATYSADE